MPATTSDRTPAPPEVVERVEAELRRGWWISTAWIAVPAVLAVLLGQVVAAEVADGDWLALLFPGVIVLVCAWLAVRLIGRAIAVKAREGRMDPAERRQAVYVRGLTGTHRVAAAGDRDALAVLDPIWRRWRGTVAAVRPVGAHRGRRGARETVEVDVADGDGRVVTALLTTDRGNLPAPDRTVTVLEDPHHPRAVLDQRRRATRGGQ